MLKYQNETKTTMKNLIYAIPFLLLISCQYETEQNEPTGYSFRCAPVEQQTFTFTVNDTTITHSGDGCAVINEPTAHSVIKLKCNAGYTPCQFCVLYNGALIFDKCSSGREYFEL